MMTSQKEIKDCVLEMLSSGLDPLMDTHGFRRPSRSLKYKRHLEEGRHTIDFLCYFHPPYQPQSDLHLYPYLCVEFERIENIAHKMMPSDPSTENGVTVRIPMEWTCSKVPREQWFASGERQILNMADKVKDFTLAHVYPFFDAYSSINGLLSAYGNRDNRVPLTAEYLLRIAAAFCSVSDYSKAREVLEARLGNLSKRRFASAFEFIRTLETETGQSRVSPGN